MLLGVVMSLHAGFSSMSELPDIAHVRFAGSDAVRMIDDHVFVVYYQEYQDSISLLTSLNLARSTDGGQTFVTNSIMDPVFVYDTTPPVLELSDGLLYIFFGNQWAVSSDFGETFTFHAWDDEDLVTVRACPDSSGITVIRGKGRQLRGGEFYRFCNFEYFVSWAIPAWYYGVDNISGRIHANTDIHLKNYSGWPSFHGYFSTYGHAICNGGPIPYDDVFLGGYAEEAEPLTYRFDSSGFDNPFGDQDIVYVRLHGDTYESMVGTITERQDTLTIYNSYPPFGPIGDSIGVNIITRYDTLWTVGPSGLAAGRSFHAPGTLWIEGNVSGKQTWYSTGKVGITGDLVYTGTTPGEPPDGWMDGTEYPVNTTDYLTVISDAQIEIKYGLWDPYLQQRRHICTSGITPPNLYLYGRLIALQETDDLYDSGTFTFEYQHPHRATPNQFVDGVLYTDIDLHLGKYPPEEGHYWPYPAASADGMTYPDEYQNWPDYPWYNPLWPEAVSYTERGNVCFFGGSSTNQRSYIHRVTLDPMDQGHWDIENHMYGQTSSGVNAPGSSGVGIGYNKEYHYDYRQQNQPIPGYRPLLNIHDDGEPAYEVWRLSGTNAPVCIDSLGVDEPFSTMAFSGNLGTLGLLTETAFLTSSDGGANWDNYPIPETDPIDDVLCVTDSTYLVRDGVLYMWQGNEFAERNPVNGSLPGFLKSSHTALTYLDDQEHLVFEPLNGGNPYSFDPGIVPAALGYAANECDSVIVVAECNGQLYTSHGNLPAPVSNDPGAASRPRLSMNLAPNPFNPELTVSYSLNTAERVQIDVFNTRGQRVRTLSKETLSAGKHDVMWNGTDDNGRSLSSGVYFVRMTTESESLCKKAVLMK
jgi:hypothetical protein